MDKRIKALFEDYGKSFSALELQKQAKLFADDFIAAGPKGIISQKRDEFIKNADKAADFYRKAGQESVEIKSTKETWFSDKYAMVTVHWAAHFKKLSKPVEFDVSYLVQLTDEKPKIILFISHEDEQEAMKELGLLDQAA
jgi:hypothetical protein